MGLTVHFEVLNQFGTPLMYSATLANRPAAGIAGRIFFRTDTPFGIYRDTGTIWDLIAIGGGTVDTNIYNTDGTLTANRTVSSGGFGLTFNPATVFDTTLTAANNASSLALFGVNRLSYAAAFSANNIGALYGGSSAFALQTFAGSATFANSNIASGGSSVNSVDFSTGGSTITMTQATGLRVMAGHINMFQYQGTNSGTITHAAVSQNLGFYRPTAATGILTITNAYGHLINNLNDYGAGFTFTNRFGIYQAGASDINYFAANVLIGSSVDNGAKFQCSGTGTFGGGAASAYTLDVTGSGRYTTSLNVGSAANTLTTLTVNGDTSIGGQKAFWLRDDDGFSGSSARRAWAITANYVNFGMYSIFVSTSAGLNPLSGTPVFNIDSNGSVLIGTSTSILSSILTLSSITQGFLPPRMTTTQKNAIATPAAGLVIYDSTLNKLCVYSGTAWETITSV